MIVGSTRSMIVVTVATVLLFKEMFVLVHCSLILGFILTRSYVHGGQLAPFQCPVLPLSLPGPLTLLYWSSFYFSCFLVVFWCYTDTQKCVDIHVRTWHDLVNLFSRFLLFQPLLPPHLSLPPLRWSPLLSLWSLTPPHSPPYFAPASTEERKHLTLTFWVWLISPSKIFSSSVRLPANASSILLYNWGKLHYVCRPHCFNPFICRWAPGRVPYLGYWELCCCKHWWLRDPYSLPILILLDEYQRVGQPGHGVVLVLVFWGVSILLYKVVVLVGSLQSH